MEAVGWLLAVAGLAGGGERGRGEAAVAAFRTKPLLTNDRTTVDRRDRPIPRPPAPGRAAMEMVKAIWYSCDGRTGAAGAGQREAGDVSGIILSSSIAPSLPFGLQLFCSLFVSRDRVVGAFI